MATSKTTKLCDICFKLKTTKNAVGICLVCREFYCIKCLKHHRVLQATEKHSIIAFEPTEGMPINTAAECDPCKKSEGKLIPASCLCGKCWELYCDHCRQNHLAMSATNDHNLYSFVPISTQGTSNSVNISSDFKKLTMSGTYSSSEKVFGPDVRPYRVSVRKLGTNTTSKKTLRHQSPSKKYSLTPLLSDNAPGKVPASAVCSSGSTGYVSYSENHDTDTSSDFKAFNNKELGAQFAVSMPRDTKRKRHLNKVDLDKMSAKIVGTICVNTNDYQNCCINGITCLNDGRLLSSDRNNYKLKMLDDQFYIICTTETQGSVCGMTKVSDDEIAVLIDNINVYFYKVTTDKFVLQRQRFKLDKKGYGLSYSRDMFAVVCDNVDGTSERGVDIYTHSGDKIQSITSIKYEIGHKVHIDTKEDRIYLSSGYVGGPFSCISLQGQLLWKLKFTGDDVVEVNNLLLVTDLSNHALVLCTKDGSYSRTLIQDKKELFQVNTLPSDRERLVSALLMRDGIPSSVVQIGTGIICVSLSSDRERP